MIDREEYLRNETHSGLNDVAKRVYLTLNDERKIAKAFAWLVNDLHSKGILSLDDVNNMLYDTRPHD